MPVISCQFDGFNELILPSGLTVFKVFNLKLSFMLISLIFGGKIILLLRIQLTSMTL